MTPCQARGRLFFHRACPRENGGQAVIPAQSLSLAKAGAGIHKKGIYFAVDSRRRGACPWPSPGQALAKAGK